ncbi:MAG: 3-oxoacyl-ACP reductase family protein, partial [Dethiobacteria bacterium]
LITGAASGMGLAIARKFVAEGAKVALNDCRKEALEEAVSSFSEGGKDVLAVFADVSNSAEVDRAVDLVLERYGRLDILVNNAGILRFQRIVDLTDEMWQRVIDVNLTGAFYCTRAALDKAMLKQRRGKIIYIASVSPYVGGPMVAPYAASKGGIIGLMRAVAKEVAHAGITANAIAPGYMVTGMTRSVYRGTLQRRLEENIALGRLGRPEDVTGAATFLASDESDYMTAHVMLVDGGSI